MTVVGHIGQRWPAHVEIAVAAGLRQFALLWPKSTAAANPIEVAPLYCVALRGHSAEAIALAADDCLAQLEFFPKPAEWAKRAIERDRELARQRNALIVHAEPTGSHHPAAPRVGTGDSTAIPPGQLAGHLAWIALNALYGVRLQDVAPADRAAYGALADTYTGCSQAADDYPTLQEMRGFVVASGGNPTWLDRAVAQSRYLARQYGVGIDAGLATTSP